MNNENVSPVGPGISSGPTTPADMADVLNDAINRIDEKREALSEQRAKFSKELAELLCPFKVGDVVWCCGYTYKSRLMRVEEIRLLTPLFESRMWCVHGRILKFDMSDSKKIGDFSAIQWVKAGSPKVVISSPDLMPTPNSTNAGENN